MFVYKESCQQDPEELEAENFEVQTTAQDGVGVFWMVVDGSHGKRCWMSLGHNIYHESVIEGVLCDVEISRLNE